MRPAVRTAGPGAGVVVVAVKLHAFFRFRFTTWRCGNNFSAWYIFLPGFFFCGLLFVTRPVRNGPRNGPRNGQRNGQRIYFCGQRSVVRFCLSRGDQFATGHATGNGLRDYFAGLSRDQFTMGHVFFTFAVPFELH
jgi:hypothetical protein